MAELRPDKPAAELRALRQLINAPTQNAVEELRRTIHRLHTEVHTPEELSSLLAPAISEALQKRIALSEHDVSAALAPIIDKAFHERTSQDKTAIVNALAPSVAKALREQHEKFPDEVAEDLAPLMGAAIREQVREQRDAMVDALYPIIGSTIAKYMAEALREFVENVNRKVERTFSFSGISRKLKSKATGVSEAELILQESMPFTVHAAFLIHKASGILIAQARNAKGKQFDSELVSGMLTAIRSFVNDWIARAGEMSEINSIEYGMSQIMLEVAGNCYLAVVVEGEPSAEFVERMRTTVSEIVAESDREIAAYEGDMSSVPSEIPQQLQALLRNSTQTAATEKKSFFVSSLPIFSLLLVLMGIPLVWSWYRAQQNQNKEKEIASVISAAIAYKTNPVDIRVDGDDVELRGQLPNDLLRRRVAEVAQKASPSGTITNAITLDEAPALTAITVSEVERVTNAVNEIEGVKVATNYRDGAIAIDGIVNDATLTRQVVAAFERLPGVSSLTYSFNRSRPVIHEIIYFAQGGSEIAAIELPKIEAVRNFLTMFPDERIRIIGHSDNDGTKARNIPLTLGRAVAVKDLLMQGGIAENRLEVEGFGEPMPNLDQTLSENRCVRFTVISPIENK